MKSNYLTFAEYIKKRRKEEGLTLVELKAKTDLTDGFLSLLENGKSKASDETIQKLSKVYKEHPLEMKIRAGIATNEDSKLFNDVLPFGTRKMKELRLESNYTYKEIEKMTGLSREKVDALEWLQSKKNIPVTIEELNLLGNVYGISNLFNYLALFGVHVSYTKEGKIVDKDEDVLSVEPVEASSSHLERFYTEQLNDLEILFKQKELLKFRNKKLTEKDKEKILAITEILLDK